MEKEKITEKQRQARKKTYSEIGKKNGRSIRAAKEKTVEDKARTFARPNYTNPILFAYRIAKYFHYMDNMGWENSNGKHIGKPYTITGIALAVGIDSHSLNEMQNGSLDHLIQEQADGSIIVSKQGIQNTTIYDIEPEYLPYTLYLLGNSDYTFTKDPLCLDLEALKPIQEWGKNVYFSSIVQKAKQTVEFQRELDLYDKGRTSDIFIHKARYGWQDETVITTKRDMISSEEARQMLEMVLQLPQIE